MTAAIGPGSKRWLTVASCMVAVCLVVLLAVRPWRTERIDSKPVPQAASPRMRRRPGVVYKPTTMPLRKAPRPDFRVDRGGEVEETEEEETEVEVEEDQAREQIPPDDPVLATMTDESEFSEIAWSMVESSSEDLEGDVSVLIESEESVDRALAGVLIFLQDALEGDLLDRVASDPDPIVALAVFDWVRDFGTEETISAMRDAIASRGLSRDYLLDVTRSSASTIGGGRSALDLWLSSFAGGRIPADVVASLVTDPLASYDVRAQAFFKLLEPETRATAMKSLEAFTSMQNDSSGVLAVKTAEKWNELAEISNPDEDGEKVWDSEAPVVFFLANSQSALPARDLANYLEYALRRDDPEFPPIIEEGTWEFANECFDRLSERREELPKEELDALDRIAVCLDRLVDYDPAFNPFETVEEDGDVDVGNVDDEEDGEEDE